MGGASEAIKKATGVDPHLAYNHDELAIGMHAANHPLTQHHREDIWHADPRVDVAGRPIGWFHASPDCTHFSQAKGGQPRSRKTRALSWVVLKWVGQLLRADRLHGTNTAPRIISMENVWQILLGRRDGRAIVWPEPTHGTAPGQKPRVTAADCLDFSDLGRSIFGRKKDLADATMRRIAKGVKRHVIDSADPFIVPVTHQGSDRVHSVHDPLRTITAANCGELMLAIPELAPFIAEHANARNQRTMPADEPLRTVCAGVKGGHFSMVTPILAGVGGRAGQSEPRSGADPLYTMTTKADMALIAPVLVQTGYGEREGQAPRALDLQQPLGTIVAGGVKHAVAVPHLVKFRGDSIGTAVTDPVPTITSGAGASRPAGAAHALGVATAFLEQANGGFYQGDGNDARDPVSTITASGSQQRLVSADLAQLSPDQEAGALRVAAFLIKYYGTGTNAPSLTDPVDTITTKDRLALVTVVVQGTPYVIVDIRLRMLKPPELFRAQGFPVTYIIDRTADGTVLKVAAQVRMCGNSVSPPPFYALIDANLDPVAMPLAEAA